MTIISIKNDSSCKIVNEVKMGRAPNGSCDVSLQHIGEFELNPGEEQDIADVSDITDIYFKNIKEYFWSHSVAWSNNDRVRLYASTKEDSSVQVDNCKFINKSEDNFDLVISKTEDIETDDSYELIQTWDGTSPGIYHFADRGGGSSSENPRWYYEPGTAGYGYVCYGPYITLDPGRYEFMWDVRVGFSCPPGLTMQNYVTLGLDICTNNGMTILQSRIITWKTVCERDGINGFYEGLLRLQQPLTLGVRTPLLEYRLLANQIVTFIIAKELQLYRIT